MYQVVKPVNVDALTKWVGAIPQDVIADMAEVTIILYTIYRYIIISLNMICINNTNNFQIAPMLEKLGYDPNTNPPNYGMYTLTTDITTLSIPGKPDEIVEKKTDDLHKNANEWYNKAVQVSN